jgi:nucleoside-diphosphate-sugar epimerase
MPTTVALTGASGFIGQAIAHRLCQTGLKVRGLVRSSKKFPSLEHPNITLVPGSLDNIESLHRLLQGCAGLVHCAGAIRGSEKNDFIPSNVQGIANLLKVCLSQPCPPRIVHLSSLAAREPSLSPYAWSKREGELLIQKDAGSLNWVIIRPPAVYGPKDEALLPLFRLGKKGIALQLGPHEGKFSLIHVQDLTDVILRSLEVDTIRSTIFEVDDGFPNGYSWELVFRLLNPHMKVHLTIPPNFLWLIGKSNEILSRLFGYTPLFTTGKVAELCHTNWVCDSLDARQQLGWTPQIPLEKGLRHLFASDSLMLSKKN